MVVLGCIYYASWRFSTFTTTGLVGGFSSFASHGNLGGSYITACVGASGYASISIPPYHGLQSILYDAFSTGGYLQQITNLGQKLDAIWDLGAINKALRDQDRVTCGDPIPCGSGFDR